MSKIFHWFYCLPLSRAMLLMLSATAVYWLLCCRFRQEKVWKAGIRALFACWMAVIVLGTLGNRAGGERAEPVLIPLYSYYTALTGGSKELFRENFMNAVLFYPAGLLGCELLQGRPRRMLTVTAGLLVVSAAIEICQYRCGLGLTEIDDVLHNTLGGTLGALAGMMEWKRPRQEIF